MKNTKLNNKGFSLVELIIVIAIMAILAAALAPQLIKYIEKSRVSSDQTSCASVKTAFDTASAQDEIYTDILANCGSGETIIVTESGGTVSVSSSSQALADEMEVILGDLKAPKSKGATQYQLDYTISDAGEITGITVDTNTNIM